MPKVSYWFNLLVYYCICHTLLSAETERYVAVVITSSRAFGLAAESSVFTEITLRMSETIEAIKLTFSKVTVRTSDRLLTFEATGSKWNEHRLN